MKYLHENVCSCNSSTCMYAAWKSHLDCLKYAIENGCSFNKQYCMNEARIDHKHIFEYLENLDH